jgi:hypothetical protein
MHTHSRPVEHDPYLATAASEPDQPTALITVAKQPARIRHHPCWCDRQQCLTSETGIRHTSTPTYLTTGEQIFVMTLIQHDPDDEPELLIKVTETGDPDGLHLLTLPEIKAFAETLLIEYLKDSDASGAALAGR